MNIDFELYRIFSVVASVGNITKASNELMVSQPAISKSIKKLEEQLGGQLFVRTKRGVVLTEEGKEFYKYIKLAIDGITSAENKFTDLMSLEEGIIKIGISTTLTKMFLLPILEKFNKLYPKIIIRIFTYKASDLIPMLRNGVIDLVILNMSKCQDNDILYVKCKEVHDCFVVNSKYMKLVNRIVSLNELKDYPLIMQSSGSNVRSLLDDYFSVNGVVFKPMMELASYSLGVEFAKIGLGVGVATREHITKELANQELFEIKIKESIPSRFIGMAVSKNHLPSFSAKKFMELIEESM